MPDASHFALHRPELGPALMRGDEKIAALMAPTAHKVEAGRILVEADTQGDHVYRVRRGWAARVRTLPDARSQFILVFLPGDLFAVKSMFVSRHPDAICTLSETVLEQIDYRTLRKAYETDSDIAMRCTWQVIEEERRLHNWVVGLGQGNADERLAMILLEFRGRLVLSGSIGPDDLTFEVPMTQEQFGDLLGISAVHVSRVFGTFRDEGLVLRQGSRLTILDLEGVTRRAAPLLDLHDRTTPEIVGRTGTLNSD